MVKNRFLIAFFIFIAFVLLLTFNQKVSAIFQVESNNDDTTFYNLPDLPKKPNNCLTTLIIQECIDSVDYFYLYYLSSTYTSAEACFVAYNNNNVISLYSNLSRSPTCYTIYRVENNEWILKANKVEYTEHMHWGYTYSENTKNNYIKDFLYTDKDVYFSKSVYLPDTSKAPFFQRPSIWKVNLFKARELAEILPMVNKLVTILLPAGLGIFSILLVLSLIKSKKWRSF